MSWATGSFEQRLTCENRNSKPRILVIMAELYCGGAEKQFRMIVDGLVADGFCVTLALEHTCGESDEAVAKNFLESRPSLNVVHFSGLSAYGSGTAAKFTSLVSMRSQTNALLRSCEFDAALVYTPLGFRMLPLFSRRGIKAVYSERNEADYTSLGWKRRGLYFNSADAIVCNSITATRNFESHGFSASFFPNGVDCPAVESLDFGRYSVSPLSDGLRIIVPARIDSLKNQMLVLRALVEVGCPSVSKVRFLGKVTDRAYLRDMEEYIEANDLGSVAEICGFTSDMSGEYELADLVVLPSFSEGTPNVLLESMARGIPCIASRIPQNEAVLDPNCPLTASCLFDPRDCHSFVTALSSVFALDDSQKRAMLEGNYAFVHDNYSIGAMLGRYEELIDALMHEKA